jgi:DMSO reductase anchor subunit
MTDQTKPWYLSRTIWAALVTIAAGGLGLVGLPIDDLDQNALVEAALQAVTAIAGLVALLGRLDARDRIG